ncbi:MAG: hypothetical protein DSY89_09945, partial [Deltaproteobacteria bacterium]
MAGLVMVIDRGINMVGRIDRVRVVLRSVGRVMMGHVIVISFMRCVVTRIMAPIVVAAVTIATPDEVGYVFGEEGAGKDAEGRKAQFFRIGRPLDMDVPITINLNRFVERSSAVFGKSGTGKTFLSRLLLAGVIQNDVAVNLIFDMHNEYGWEGTAEHTSKVKGLKQIFPGQVAIFTLDDESSRRRGSNP